MRMSIPAYVSLGLAVAMVGLAYAAHPQSGFLLAALPAILVLVGVPLILNEMNRRHMDKIDVRDFKLYRVKDLAGLPVGEPVRLRGQVKAVSLKWLNRPHFQVSDGSGTIGVFMVWAPREDIKPGDSVEAVGSLRLGLSKKKLVWGIKMQRLNSSQGTKR
ncbi:hypothetical membrane protein [Pelotomaculum thermopropionicum SI]|uniref:Hypothetical membrane protein n=1 Tax=Pelotomaculum thermopropionicum (strain DSM 13744 / JCM 10971 / SI) TaxID=370438 RepID=A5CYU9_PELTS|nr:hypothetical membrane protein [Pelotomaculum thermopropionicum SI]